MTTTEQPPSPIRVGVSEAIDMIGFGMFQVRLGASVGIAYMGDSVEMLLLSMLGPALACQWDISDYQQASLTTVVFIGQRYTLLHVVQKTGWYK